MSRPALELALRVVVSAAEGEEFSPVFELRDPAGRSFGFCLVRSGWLDEVYRRAEGFGAELPSRVLS